MQEKLVVYIHAHALDRPSWAVVGVDGSVRQSALHDGAEGLAQIAADKEVVVVVPAEDVLLTTCRLPKMNRSRLQQALPYAFEEQLIGDIETLHFAIGDYQPNIDFGVAIVSHEKMHQWISLLQTWQLKASAIIPLTYALPLSENTWHALIEEMAVIRTSASLGVACDRNNFSTLLNLALASSVQKPAQIIVKNYSSEAMPETESVPAEDFIIDVARSIMTTSYINLLQGKYAVKKTRLPQLDNVERKVVNLAKIVLLLLFLYPLGSLFILNNRVKAIDDKIVAIYKYHFPQSSSVTAPKARMQEKLNKLEAQISENRFLLLLGYLGKGMTETPSIKLKRLDFQNNQITLALTASSEDFTSFTDFLTARGLKVKQQNATITGERMSATLQVE